MDEPTRDESVGPPCAGSPTEWLPAAGHRDPDTLRRATAGGVRLFDAAEFYEPHDCFEKGWPSGSESCPSGFSERTTILNR